MKGDGDASRGAKARPFITVNFALTWDGKISTRNKTRSDFSSKRDKHRLLEIRATADAVLVGKTTVETERMSIGLPDEGLRAERIARGKPPYPTRVILTNTGRINLKMPLFSKRFSPLVIYSMSRMPKRTAAALRERAALHLSEGETVDLETMLRSLRADYGVKRLVCEGGPTLLRSLLERDLVDELHVTFCPRIFGGVAAPTLTGLPDGFLSQSVCARLRKMEVIGEECFLTYRILRKSRNDSPRTFAR